MTSNILQQLYDAYFTLTFEENTKEKYLKQIQELKIKFDEKSGKLETLNKKIKQLESDESQIKTDPEVQVISKEKPAKLQKKSNAPIAIPKKENLHFSKRRLLISGLVINNNHFEEKVADYFKKYGTIEDISRPRKDLPFTFITFSTLYETPPNYHKINGRDISIMPLNPFNDPALKTNAIVVNGLLSDLSEVSIENYFSQFGKVLGVHKPKKEVTQRYAYVKFYDPKCVDELVKTVIHLIEGKIVDIRKSR